MVQRREFFQVSDGSHVVPLHFCSSREPFDLFDALCSWGLAYSIVHLPFGTAYAIGSNGDHPSAPAACDTIARAEAHLQKESMDAITLSRPKDLLVAVREVGLRSRGCACHTQTLVGQDFDRHHDKCTPWHSNDRWRHFDRG